MYDVRALPSAQRDLDAFDHALLKRLGSKILSLKNDPRPAGTVKLSNDEGYRLRVGDYRILYRVDDKAKTVFVYRVKHRKEAYR